MKPISLTLEAFGPYLERTTIDFTPLNEAGLFLIAGQTGGGKTTLLDGMCIALFNAATGGRREFAEMRTLFAPDDRPTETTFVFSLGETKYRFTRIRKLVKKRGADELVPREEHACYRFESGDWTLLESGAPSRVTDRAKALLSLTAEQFSQVAVLPQGEFLRLLRANSREKGAILKTLFSAEIWDRVITVLNTRAGAARARLDGVTAKREERLAQSGAENADGLAEQAAQLAETCERTEISLAEAQKKAKDARAALERAVEAERLRAEQDAAKAQCEQAAARAKETDKNLETAQRGAARIEELRAASAAFERRIASLQQEKSRSAARERAARELRAETARAKALEKDAEAAHAARETAETRVKNGEAYLAGLRESLAARASLLEKKTRLETLARRAAELQSAEAAEKAAKAAEEAARQEAFDARLAVSAADKLLSSAQARSRRNAAAALAAALEDGVPCPVCGAVHHPSPAAAEEAVTEAELSALSARLETLRNAHTKAESDASAAKARHTAAMERLAAIRAESGEEAYAKDELERQLRETAAALDAAEKNAAKIPAAEKKIADLRGESETAAQNGAKAESLAAASRSAALQLEKQLAEMEDARALSAIAAEENEAAHQAETLQKETGALEQSLRTAAERSAEARGLLRAAETRQKEAEASLASFGPLPKESAAACREALSAAQKTTDELLAALGRLQETRRAKEENLSALRALDRDAEAAEAEFRRVGRLAALLSGSKNAMKTPILQYVLGMMLDETIHAANRFFGQLSRGRYALRRMTEAKGGNARAGLDIEVMDGAGGLPRSIETLSGGEQFLASLSLAFGLSEVVQGYSGAVRLDSIFIDEGFGSLDADTLDTAMRALETIRQSGRVVGIISHVAELQSRIPAAIRVTRRENGSAAARVVVPD